MLASKRIFSKLRSIEGSMAASAAKMSNNYCCQSLEENVTLLIENNLRKVVT